jgi:hypothetical protein
MDGSNIQTWHLEVLLKDGNEKNHQSQTHPSKVLQTRYRLLGASSISFKFTMESFQNPPACADTALNEWRRIAMITLREAYATLEIVPESAKDIVNGHIEDILDKLKQIGK